jgi:glutamate formiminotransferase/formiminotetrahydrofolate cyclodeaminase
MDFAKALAKKIRTSGGGLPALRAKEIFLESKNQVQISTVLTNYGVTSIKKVLDEIKKEIEPKGIKITDTELIGLTAQKPLVDYSIESLKVSNFNYENQVLENKIAKLLSGWEMGANFVVDALSNTNPTPGGGSAAAICGSMGAALIEMALGITVKAKKTPEDLKNKLNGYLLKIKNMRSELQSQMSEDAASFDTVMAAFKLPKEDPNRKSEIQKALVYAANIPLKTARICAEISSVAREVLEVEVKQDVISDYRSGLYMLECGVKCALENVYINAKSIEDETVKKNLLSEAENLVKAVSLK